MANWTLPKIHKEKAQSFQKAVLWKIFTKQKKKVNLAKCLSVLLIFSKNQFLIFWYLYCVYFIFHLVALIFLLSLHIYFFGYLFHPKTFRAPLSYYFWDSQFFHVDTWDYKFSPGLPSFGPLIWVFILNFSFNKNRGVLKFPS